MIDTNPEDHQERQERPSESDPSSLEEELSHVKQILAQLTKRVTSLEHSQEVASNRTTQPEILPPDPPPDPSFTRKQSPVPTNISSKTKSVRKIPLNWEQVLGLNWLAIIGGISLAIGMGFFLKLSFQNNWIGETGRVILGIVSGVAFLIIGEYFQRRYPAWAQAVSGSGTGILYLSIYSAFGFFDLIDPIPAFLLLTMVISISTLLAIRYESRTIALLGIFGAFLTPVLLARDLPSDQRYFMLVYILLIDIGILGISTLRNWRWFTLVGLIGSYFLFSLWLDQLPPTNTVPVLIGATGIFLVFVGATTLFHILWRRTSRPADLILMSLNAILYYWITFETLWSDYQIWFGLITLSLSLFYGLLGYGAIKRTGTPPQVSLYSIAIALVFLTIAIPVHLSGSWITLAWAAEGAVLIWVGLVLRSWPTRTFALGILAIAAFQLLIFFVDYPINIDKFRIFLNNRFITFGFAISAFSVSAYLYWKYKNQLQEWETNIFIILTSAANLLSLWILSNEIISYFDSRAVAAGSFEAVQNADNGRLSALTVLWAIYSLGILGIALAKRSNFLRLTGLALLAIVVIKLILIDTFVIDLNPAAFMLILNFQFLSSITVLVAVLFSIYLYWRQRTHLFKEEQHVLISLLIIANFIAVWILSTEVLRFFYSQESQLDADLSSAKSLSLTILWAVYAVGILAAGIIRRSSKVRLGGLVLLSVPVVKLFTFDVLLLDGGYRVAAFGVLGILLLGSGLAYQRYREIIKEFLVGDQR